MERPIHLLDLVCEEKLDRMLRVFTDVAGVASIITHPDGSPLTKPHNFSQLCARFCRSTEEGRRKCQESDRYGGVMSVRSGEPHIYGCLNAGLIDCAAPIVVEGCHLATILCGQVVEEALDPESAVERAIEIGVNDIDGYLAELSKIPVMNRERLIAIAGLMAEITQTISELALQKTLLRKQSESYLTKLVNSVSDCILSTDSHDKISMINEAGARMFGREDRQIRGQSIVELLADSKSMKTYQEKVDQHQRDGWRAELNVKSAAGRVFPVQVSMSGLHDEAGRHAGYVGVLREISEEKKVERMKQDLIGMVTHDMRNPSLSVQRALQLLVDGRIGPLNTAQREITRLALATSHQLYGMASDLLDIYRDESGHFLLHRSNVDMRSVIEDSIRQLDFIAKEKGVTVRFECNGGNTTLEGDSGRLMRTVVNLLDNAIRYTPEEGEVFIECASVDPDRAEHLRTLVPASHGHRIDGRHGYVVTRVRDQGTGIPKKYKHLVFNKFFSLKSDGQKGRKGVGLGLAFCKQIIEAHGGFIWVVSPVDHNGGQRNCGCQFSFMLPTRCGKQEEAGPVMQRLT